MERKPERFKVIVIGETTAAVAAQLRKMAQEVEQGYRAMNVVEFEGSRVMRPMLPSEKCEYQNAYSME